MPIKTIAIATDLTEEEVKKIIKEFKLEEQKYSFFYSQTNMIIFAKIMQCKEYI